MDANGRNRVGIDSAIGGDDASTRTKTSEEKNQLNRYI